MEILSLNVENRDQMGKGATRRLRNEKRVPGVFYGPKQKTTIPISVDAREFSKTARRGSGSLIKLKADSDKDLDGRMALIKDSQRHPVSRDYLHVDLYEVDMDKSLKIKVPIKPVGKSPGVAEGGILDIIRREIEVQCLPNNIPYEIEIDISELTIGDNYHVQDLKMPEGVKPTGDVNYTVVAISSPDEEETVRPEAAGEEELSAEVPRVGEEEDGEEGESKEGETASEGGEKGKQKDKQKEDKS